MDLEPGSDVDNDDDAAVDTSGDQLRGGQVRKHAQSEPSASQPSAEQPGGDGTHPVAKTGFAKGARL